MTQTSVGNEITLCTQKHLHSIVDLATGEVAAGQIAKSHLTQSAFVFPILMDL